MFIQWNDSATSPNAAVRFRFPVEWIKVFSNLQLSHSFFISSRAANLIGG
jgi:hypothetical protein